jgi:hypothetical protein
MDTLIPAFLRRQRNQRRLTLEMLSAKAGMSPQHLSEIESGKRDPRLSCDARCQGGGRYEGPEQLAVRRQPARRRARCGSHVVGALGAAQRP